MYFCIGKFGGHSDICHLYSKGSEVLGTHSGPRGLEQRDLKGKQGLPQEGGTGFQRPLSYFSTLSQIMWRSPQQPSLHAGRDYVIL